MKALSALLLSACFALFSMAQALTLDDIHLQKYSTFKTDFSLQKQITNLNIPYIANGSMIFDRNLGLWWQQNFPFVQTVKANQNRIQISMPDGSTNTITAENRPQLFKINKLVNSLLNGDIKRLNDDFTVVVTEVDRSTWQLLLTPKSPQLQKIVNQITVIGDQYVQSIETIEPKNQNTVIHFYNQESSPLTADQQKLFN